MIKRYNILVVLGVLMMTLGSCEMRDELRKLPSKEDQKEEGWFTLDVAYGNKAEKVDTKAVFDQNDVDPKQYPVDIINTITGETAAHYATYADLLAKGQIKLTAGKYRVVAYNYNGADVNASERPWFRGITEFEILPGKTTKVNTTCKLQNVAVTIVFEKDFKDQFKDDYAITVTNGDGGVRVYNKEFEGKTIYFKVPEKKNSVQLTVKATTNTNNQIAQNYTVSKPTNAEGNSNLVSGDEFTVKIGAGDEPSVDPTTQIQLDITVDLTMHETGVTIEIPTENIVFEGGTTKPDPEEPTDPESGITVVGLGETFTLPLGDKKVQVSIEAPKGINKLIVKIDSDNEDFMSTLAGFGLADPFDLANPGDLMGVLSGSLEDGEGIGLIDATDPIKGKTSYLFDVTDFMTLLTLYGKSENTFTLTIEDGVNEPVMGTLTVIVPE